MGREFLQGPPAFPREIGRADDVSKETAPFHHGPLDVAVAKRFIGEPITSSRIHDELANYFRRARSVLDRHAHFEIAGMIGAAVGLLAKNPKPATHGRVFAGKTRTRADIAEIEDKIVDRISFILESRGDGEPFAGMEKRKEHAT